MATKIKFVIIRVGLILSSLGLIALGVAKYGDIAAAPIIIIIGILLLIVLIVRWKDLENVGK